MTIKAQGIRRLYLLIGLATIAVFSQGSDCGAEPELTEVDPALGTCLLPNGEQLDSVTEAECNAQCDGGDCWEAYSN